MKDKLTIGKLREFLSANPQIDDNVVIYYPHYYKGYGLTPVGEIENGKVPYPDSGGEKDKTVVVLDWRTSIHSDECFMMGSTSHSKTPYESTRKEDERRK